MDTKFPFEAVNESGTAKVDVSQLKVPDGAITAGSNQVDLTSTGTGDVVGPASSTDRAIAVYNGTGGKTIQNSGGFVDTNGNIYAPNIAGGLVSTATAAGTTTLTVASTGTQVFTGATTQTVVLPAVSTLPQIGFGYRIINNSSGVVTVNSSGSNLVATVAAGSSALILCQLLTGTSAASWNAISAASQTPWTSAIAGAGYALSGAGNISGNVLSGAFATTATAAGTTTLTVASAENQEFTGATTQTIVLPVVSTLPQTGFAFFIINNSSGTLTINSSGANLVQTLLAGQRALVSCILLTGTNAASWSPSIIPNTASTGFVTFVAPTLGVATATSVNKVVVTAPATSSTLTISDGATLTVESTINSQANDYTGVLADSGKTVLITGVSKTFTIPANASVAYALGTCLSGIFTNASGGSVAITSDTMTLANSTSTGTRTVAQNGRWTAQKLTSTTWLIAGVGLT